MNKPQFKGLTLKTIKQISTFKKEPLWMQKFRLQALSVFQDKPLPVWGGDLSKINFSEIDYYLPPDTKQTQNWQEVPEDIKNTYQKLGILEAEQQYLAGVKAQWDSEVVYGSILKELKVKGVIFLSMDQAVLNYPDLVKKYFATLVPISDNKFAALNSAVWSGGSFLYVPKGVKVEMPLQAYFRINAQRLGQFERTLIIADEGSFVHYLEGCTSPIYTNYSLHAGVVEIFVKKGARVRYTTVQNWSKNVYNLVTKRAKVEEDGVMEWIDFNGGSKLTMKYPAIYLTGKRARGEILSLAVANSLQHQDTGSKVFHLAPQTFSKITSKSISLKGGRSSYRGLLKITKGAKNAKSKVSCDALILDPKSFYDTYPNIEVEEPLSQVEHEATVSKIGIDQLFYLQSRGISETEAESLIVNGFIEPIAKEIPLEYAVELNRLIKLEMEGF